MQRQAPTFFVTVLKITFANAVVKNLNIEHSLKFTVGHLSPCPVHCVRSQVAMMETSTTVLKV